MPSMTVRQMLTVLGYTSGDRERDTRAALRDLKNLKETHTPGADSGAATPAQSPVYQPL